MLLQPGKSLKRTARKSQIRGEIPVIVGGSDAWQLMRYLSFSPWRVTGPNLSRDIGQEQIPLVRTSLQNMQ